MKKILPYIFGVLLLAYLVGAFVVDKSVDSRRVCSGMKILVQSDDTVGFVTHKFISSELVKMNIAPKGKAVNQINTQEIEDAFLAKDYVESAQCYVQSDNSLLLEITPLKPVLRVFEGGKSYYVNRSGKRIASNAQFFKELPVVSGNFSESYPPTRLLPLTDYIESKQELKNLVSMIEVADSNNIFIIPTIAHHVVNMGCVEGYESKFAKLMRMYREVLPVKGYNFYDTITLKWDHMIVATKRTGGSRLKIEQATDEEDEAAPDVDTMTGSKNMIDTTKNN